MPIINTNKRVKGPLDESGYSNPNLGLSGTRDEPLGSRDNLFTRMSGYFGETSSYDAYFNPMSSKSQNDRRFENEDWGQWFANNSLNILSKAGTSFADGISTLMSAAYTPISLAKGNSFWDAFDKNPLFGITEGWNKVIDENLPSLSSDEFKERSFLDSLKSPAQLISSNVDTFGFLVSSFTAAGLLSKLGAGSRIVSRLSANSLDDIINSAAKANNLASKASNIDFILANSVLTSSESMAEALDAKRSLIQDLESKRANQELFLTDEEIQQRASQAASNVFLLNMATSAVTNIPFVKLVTKMFGKTPSSLDLGIKLTDKGFDKQSFKGVNRLLKSKEFLPSLTRSAIINSLTEGLEESIQYTIQDINSKSLGALDLQSSIQTFLSKESLHDTTLGIFSDKERGKAAGLGSLLGLAGVGLASSSIRRQSNNYANAQQEAINKLNTKFDGVVKSVPFKKSEGQQVTISKEESENDIKFYRTVGSSKQEITPQDYIQEIESNNLDINSGGSYKLPDTYQTDDNGNFVIDQDAIASTIATAHITSELDSMIEDAQSYSKNELKLDLLRQEQLAELTRTALESGAVNLLVSRFQEVLQDQQSMDRFQIKKEDIDSYIQTVKDLKNIYDNVNSDLIARNPEENRLNSIRKSRMFQLGAKSRIIKNLIAKSEANARDLRSRVVESIENLQEFDEQLKQVVNSKQRAVSLSDLFRKFDSVSTDNVSSLVDQMNKLSSFEDIKNQYSSSEYAKLVDELVNQNFLKEAEKEISDVYNAYLTTKDLSKIRGIESEAFKTQGVINKGIQFSPEMSSTTFLRYIDNLERNIDIADRRKIAQDEMSSAAIQAIVESIINNPLDSAQEVYDMLDSVKDFVNYLESTKSTPKSSSIDELQSVLSYIADKYEGELYYDEFDDEHNLSNIAISLSERLSILPKFRIEDLIPARQRAVSNLYSNANAVLQDFRSFPDEYEDIASVELEISKSETLISMLDKVGINSSELKEILEGLRGSLDQVRNNLLNKELKNKKQLELYSNGMLYHVDDTILSILSSLPDFNLQSFNSIRASDPYTASLIISQALSMPDIRDQILPILNKKAAQLEEDSKLLHNQRALDFKNYELSVKSPSKFISQIINNRFKVVQGSEPIPDSISKFLSDYDMVSLLNADDPIAKDLATFYFKAQGLHDLIRISESSISATEILLRIKSKVDEGSSIPAPSSAQERVITQLTHFFSQPMQDSTPNNNIAVLKSPPGAGKSLLIVPYLLHTLGLSSKNVIASSPKILAANNIAKTIGLAKGLTREDLIQAFDSSSIDPSVSIVVFDEAGTSSDTELSELSAAFTRWQIRNPDRKLKLLYLYDPNQGTGRADGASALDVIPTSVPSTDKDLIDSGQKHSQGILHYVQNMYDVLPLPVSYRSDVPQILSLQNKFLSTANDVDSLIASTDSDVKTSNSLLGTYVDSSNQLLRTIINNSIAKNPNKTRVIIVSNDDDKPKYSDLNVDVLTVSEVAGLTYDEAYIDIPKIRDSSRLRQHNSRMYTAISRARNFVYLANYSGENSIDATIQEKVDRNKLYKSSRHKESSEQKQEILDAISNTLGIQQVSTPPQTNQSGSNPVIPTEPDESIESVQKDELKVVTMDSNKGIYTNNEVLKTLLDNKVSDLVLVRTNDNFRVLAPARGGQNNLYYDVAIIDNTTGEDIIQQLELPLVRLVEAQAKADNIVSSVPNLSPNVKLDPNSNTIRYLYSNSVTEDFSSKDGLLNLVSRFITSFNQAGGNISTTIEDIKEAPDKFLNLRVYTSIAQTEKDFGKNNRVPLGKPLLVISSLEQVNSADKLKPQFIELSTPAIDSSSKEFERYHGPQLLQAVQLIKSFTEILSSLNLPQEYSNYKSILPGVPLISQNGSPYYPFHALVTSISEAAKSNSDIISLASEAQLSAYNKLNPNIALPPIKAELLSPLFSLATEIDTLLHGSYTTKRAYGGKAQVALDRIASSNNIVELPNMTTKIMRTTRVRPDNSAETYTGGITLLGPISWLAKPIGRTSYGMSYNPQFSQEVIDDLKERQLRDPDNQWLKSPAIKALLESGDAPIHTTNFTLQDMLSLFTPEGMRAANSGFGLRQPIYSPVFSENGIPIDQVDLYQVVESYFNKIVPTTLGLTWNGKTTLQETEKQPDAIKSLESSAKSKVRQEVLTGLQSDFTSEEIKYLDSIGGKQALIANYEDSTIFEQINKPNFIKLMKGIFSNTFNSLQDALTKVFTTSALSLDSTLKTAPRDFTASYLISKVLGRDSSESFNERRNDGKTKSSTVLDIVKYYYSSTKNDSKTQDKFNDLIMRETSLSEQEINEVINELNQAAITISKENNLEFKSSQDPFTTIQNIVLLSSAYRKLNIQEKVVTEPIEEYSNTFMNAVSIPDFIKATEGLDIHETLKGIVETNPEITLEELKERADELIKFFSLEIEFNQTNPQDDSITANTYNKLFRPMGINFISRLFKQRVQFVTLNEMAYRFGKEAWGVYKDGVSYIVSKDGKSGSIVGLHEAFHHVFNAYLNDWEKQTLLKYAKDRYGDKSSLELEEDLANDFMKYKSKPKSISGKIQSIFRRILRFFNFTYNNLSSIEAFFESTLDGGFFPRNGSSSTRYLEIERFFKTSNDYKVAKNYILDKFEDIGRYNEQQGVLMSFEETVSETFKEVLSEFIDNTIPDNARQALQKVITTPQGIKQFSKFFFNSTPTQDNIRKAVVNARQSISEELELIKQESEKLQSQLNDDLENLQDSSEFQYMQERKEFLEGLQQSNIYNETIDVELTDPESKITGVVKQRMMNIKYMKSGQVVRDDFGKIFVSSIGILSGIDLSNTSNLIASVKSRTKSLLSDKQRSKSIPSNVRAATALFIENEVEKLSMLMDQKPKHIVFRKDVNSEHEYLLISKSKKDITEHTFTTASVDPDISVFFYNPSTSGSMDKWVQTINEDYRSIYSAYRYYEQSNFIKSLIGAVASLRKMNPSIGVKSYTEGVFKSKYLTQREAGASAALEADIVNSYITLSEKQPKGIFNDIIPQLNSIEDKTHEELFSISRRIMSRFGIDGLRIDDTNKEDLITFLQKSKLVLPKLNDIKLSAYDQINDESSFIGMMIDLRQIPGDLIQNPSFMRGDGKKGYLWIDASFQTSLLSAVMNSVKGVLGTTFSHVDIQQGKITSKTPLYKSNIFTLGKRIHSFVDHDSLKWSGRAEYAKTLYSEKPEDFLSRSFDMGFLSRFSKSSTYIQFLPIPSNRRTINGAEIDFHRPTEVRSILKSLVESQKNRPEPNDENRLANNTNYLNNYKKFNLPGLAGIDVNSISTNEAVDKIIDHISSLNMSETLLKYLSTRPSSTTKVFATNYKIDLNNLLSVYKKLSGSVVESESDYRKKLSKMNQKLSAGEVSQSEVEQFVALRDDKIKEVLSKVILEYQLNYLVNSYYLSQLIYGDETFYKSKEDLTKRIQVFTATGDVALTGKDGMNQIARVGVMKDIEVSVDDIDGIRDDSFNDVGIETDGQGFMLPEYYEKLAAARGKFTEDDITLKTVYASVDDQGIPTLLKYSIIVLTDDLIGYDSNGVPKNKRLHNLRQAMRNPSDGGPALEQAIFQSGVKLGSPKKENLSDVSSDDISFGPQSIISVDNRFMRFQLNPSYEVETSVANPSQLTSFIDTNGNNANEALRVYDLNSMLIHAGSKIASLDLGINRKGKVTSKSEKVLRRKAIRTNQGMPGKELMVSLISASSNGKPTVSLNLPLVASQLVSSLSSIISSKSVGIRFPGSKLVLQSEFGTYQDHSKRLKYKDEEGYTEVLMPSTYKDILSVGDKIHDYMVGFRIPSTNLHSGISLKVAGFYEVPKGSKGNIVITPASITYLHGSDYDIDSLFVIRKERLSSEVDLKQLGLKYDVNIDQNFNRGSTIYDEQVNSKKANDFLFSLFNRINNKLHSSRLVKNEDDRLEDIEADLRLVYNLLSVGTKNEIVDIFSSSLRDPKNRTDILTPISFRRVSSTKHDLNEEFKSVIQKPKIRKELLSRGFTEQDLDSADNIDSLLSDRDLDDFTIRLYNKFSNDQEDSVLEMFAKLEATKRGMTFNLLTSKQANDLVNPQGTSHDYSTQMSIHSNTYAGVALTGIAANIAKTLGYIFSASQVDSVKFNDQEISFTKNGSFSSSLLSEFLTTNNFKSLNEAIRNGAVITKLTNPELNFEFKYKTDDKKLSLNSLSRFELDENGKPKQAYKGVPINIFETLDTIINLAIDNVKEQKLFLLGITNSNANTFLSGIAMGVPLNTMALIFKSPGIAQASLQSKFSSKDAKSELKKKISQLTQDELFEAIKEYSKYDNIDNFSVDKNTYHISEQYLRDSYVTGQSNIIGDYIIYSQLSNLESLGQQLYDYSTLLSSLRGIPSDKSDIDSVIEVALKYEAIESELIGVSSNLEFVRKQVYEEKSRAISEQNPNMSEQAVQKIVDSLDKDIIEAEILRRHDSSFMSRLISGSVIKKFTPTSKSSFKNITLMSLPHIYEAWAATKKVQHLIENTFTIFSPILKGYSDRIASELSIGNKASDLRQIIPKEVFKIITSDMSVDTPFGTVNFSVDPNLSVQTSSQALYGVDAWSHNLAMKLEEIKRFYRITQKSSPLLESIEITQDFYGKKNIVLTADKTSNIELLMSIKEDFINILNNPDIQINSKTISSRQIALDLFKYANITNGMFYSRTGLALVFPLSFSEAYSSKLESKLSKVFERDNLGNIDHSRTKANLDLLMPSFIYQFLRNNPQVLPYRKNPVRIADYVKDGEFKSVFTGNDGQTFFDMKFHSISNPPKYISSFGKDCLILTKSDMGFDYYTKISSKHNVDIHIYPSYIDESKQLNLEVIKNLDGHLLPKSFVNIDTIRYPFNYQLLNTEDTFYIHNFSEANPTQIQKAVVLSAKKTIYGYDFKFKLVGNIDLLNDAVRSPNYNYNFAKPQTYKAMDNSVELSDKDFNFAIPSEVLSKIESLPVGNYKVESSLLNSFYDLNPNAALKAANMLRYKTGVNFDILDNYSVNSDSLVSGYLSGLNVSEIEDGLYLYKKKDNPREEFRLLQEGSFYYVGIQNQTEMYVYVKQKMSNKAELYYIPKAILNQMPSGNVSLEEFVEVVNNNC